MKRLKMSKIHAVPLAILFVLLQTLANYGNNIVIEPLVLYTLSREHFSRNHFSPEKNLLF